MKNLMAKALYDNMPESPEELAFRKGDILTVIEQNTGGLEGWWLCSLHGRQGIAPGNRLKLLIGPMFEAQSPGAAAAQSPPQSSAYQQKAGSGGPQGVYQVPPSLQSPQQPSPQGVYQAPPGQDVYQVPPRSALMADNAPNKLQPSQQRGPGLRLQEVNRRQAPEGLEDFTDSRSEPRSDPLAAARRHLLAAANEPRGRGLTAERLQRRLSAITLRNEMTACVGR
ncbi:Enhancer of filamentation 1 [Liparis tanakae]|uniref:Enhancer of filamentation 1 n=1 Tax=Liparis tanakae TaxID=230148 RepID=A0A4Z2FNC5_9TELE|nr:Enhancer of filamentation 1 [Liparis tanakae]